MTPWMDAIDRLRQLGYSVNLDGGKLRYTYQRKGNPLVNEITPLLDVLKAHKGEVSNDPYFLIEQTIQTINAGWKPGALEWMKRTRPKEWERMFTLEQEINRLALQGDVERLRKSLDGYQGLMIEMVEIFRIPKGETDEQKTIDSHHRD
jgi:hypothetical protein